MASVWSPENKFQRLLDVELAVAKVQADLGIIPRQAFPEMKKKAKFQIKRIDELEKTTKHDVIAFVSNVAENIGEKGKYLHFGLTSSDVLDTATSLLIKDASEVLFESIKRLEKELTAIVSSHMNTPCVGRTHGMHAEPTTFGYKMSGYLAELKRNQIRVMRAVEQCLVVKLSGPVGTYSTTPESVEKKAGEILKLQQETVATQVVPRDRHAELMTSLALLMAGIERLAVELRHLQRTEVGEVEEGFTKGQKGSSAMPHKKNPIGSENLTGLARLVRSMVQPALENIVLWHERDISHSSVERVILGDSLTLTDYAVDRMAGIIKNLKVNKKRMIENLQLTQGQIYSARLLLTLVEKGFRREEAYAILQRVSHGLDSNKTLLSEILKDTDVKKVLKKNDLKHIEQALGLKNRVNQKQKRVNL
ncbi:MAG: adenylosuccinate lyase [Bdellovibrionales bacterium]